MTTPMENLPGKTLLCRRDTANDLPLFVPDDEADTVRTYALAVACSEFRDRLDVLEVGFDLTRELIVLHDHTGCVSDFFERLHQLMAKAIKKRYGLSHGLWKPHQQFRREYLETPDDVMEAIADVRAMPVREGRVKYASRYPGLILGDAYFDPVTIERPEEWFGDGLPATAVLQLRRPPCFEHLRQGEWKALLRQKTKELERQYRAERRTRAEGYMGQETIRALDPRTPLAERHRPDQVQRESVRANHDEERGRRVARRLRTFRSNYRPTWLNFAAGDHTVVFPAGTLQVARYAGARTDDPHEAARRCGYPVRDGPAGA